MPQAATKSQPASPLAQAEAEQQGAHAEVERLTKAVAAHRNEGVGFDAIENARLVGERDSALRDLRHADLAVHEAGQRPYGPLSDRAVQKIRAQRRRVFDRHPQLLARLSESRRLRERQQALENAIVQLRDSPEFRHDAREMLRVFGGGVGDPKDTSRSGRRLAELERDLTITTGELEIALAVQTVAQTVWEAERATLQNWEEAVRALGPAGRRALAAIPQPSAEDDDLVGYADVSAGPNQMPYHLHQQGKNFSR